MASSMIDIRRKCVTFDTSMHFLPMEYQRAEYIKSDGNAYIITDIPVQSPIEIVTDVAFTFENADEALFATGYVVGSNRVRIGFGQYVRYPQWYYTDYYNARSSVDFKLKSNQRYVFNYFAEEGYQTYYQDNIQGLTSTGRTPSALLPIDPEMINFYIFCEGRNDNGNVRTIFPCTAKLYSLKVMSAKKVLGEFIPCYRKTNGEIGLYDLIQRKFYSNSGGGQFLKGDDV